MGGEGALWGGENVTRNERAMSLECPRMAVNMSGIVWYGVKTYWNELGMFLEKYEMDYNVPVLE